MGAQRREKRRQLRAVNKVKPRLNYLLDTTEFYLKQYYTGTQGKDELAEVGDIIDKCNKSWQRLCSYHNITSVISAYLDGTTMIKNRLQDEQQRTT